MQVGIEVDKSISEKVVRQGFFDEPQRSRVLSPLAFSPQAKHLGELISAKQIQIAYKLSSVAGIDGNRLAQELFDFDMGELSRTAAESLIAVLEDRVFNLRSRCDLRLTG